MLFRDPYTSDILDGLIKSFIYPKIGPKKEHIHVRLQQFLGKSIDSLRRMIQILDNDF